MASAAAPKANPYSLSLTNSRRLHSSSIFSLKIPFFLDPRSPRLVSVQSHNPNLDSIKMDRTVPASGSGSGKSTHLRTSSSPSDAIDFLTLCHRLKSTKRKGWINHGIKGPESIADHMYRMSLMALIADDLPGVNRERCIKIAIVHDIAEAIVGDITPSDGVPKEEKSRMEQEALDEMCKVLGDGMRAEEIKELWQEYENNSTLEANLVKDFDKVEMILQALEYETEHGKVLDEFFPVNCRKNSN
ncbi:HD domain-containing protein c4g3.17 [Phtheirospermum japonicum]|uniref:5'-deoxynucleotidase n=1 Tax=Phtheirospermum japonicum TaxID=374723 RepID=A0A830CL29_9LAMI|nr:HD domain-containing protein c4g3.17 [Phtheirospermum japonicum]